MINRLIAESLPYMPQAMVSFFARRYVAGKTPEDAFALVRELNGQGAMATIDLLGEFTTEKEKARQTVGMYKQVLDAVGARKLDANISIKPSAFGALVSLGFATENITEVVEYACAKNIFVRIDMENHPYTDYTLELYLDLDRRMPGCCGTVLQAYLKRTQDDIRAIASRVERPNIRLCKGIYVEPEDIAWKNRRKIQENYLESLDLLFAANAYVGIATHDDVLVDGALELIEKHALTTGKYEFQMLLGVRSELRHRLLCMGRRLRVYTPFGADWLPYSIRRLKENPAIVGSAIKGFLSGGR
jgi:proline dehydrogenase